MSASANTWIALYLDRSEHCVKMLVWLLPCSVYPSIIADENLNGAELINLIRKNSASLNQLTSCIYACGLIADSDLAY